MKKMRFSDSDMTSYLGSSSSSSPRRSSKEQVVQAAAYYYVQAPSSDSRDGDKSSSSLHSSPVSDSPIDSPSHPITSESRISSNFTSPPPAATTAAVNWVGKPNRKKRWSSSLQCEVILEEATASNSSSNSTSSYDHFMAEKRLIKRLRIFIALFSFLFLFTLLCFILWGASRPYKPDITVKSLTLNNFYVGEGSDFSGVITTMVTLNGSLHMSIYNPAPFFGIHVTSNLINLAFWEITVATGQIRKYYQPRKSHRTVVVNLKGNSIPIYGAASSFKLYGPAGGIVPLNLQFKVQSRADVVGKLVQTRHNNIITCPMLINSTTTTKPITLRKDNCTYGW